MVASAPVAEDSARMRRRAGAIARVCGALLTGVLASIMPSTVTAQPTGPTSSTGVPIDPPTLLSEPDVSYPNDAHGDATAILVLVIDADGSVRSATGEGADPIFIDAAASAARSWKFEPAKRAGVPVAAKIKIAITFRTPFLATPTHEPAAGSPAPKSATPERVEEVRVRGTREPSRTGTLSRSEVRQIPGAFGDPFRAVEIMPGVTSNRQRRPPST